MQNSDKKIPLAFFTYNRPHHTERALDALYSCHTKEKFDFYFYSDAPAQENMTSQVAEVRKILRRRAKSFSATIVERDTNFGLAKSIVDGVDSLCDEYGTVVVVEDDLEVSSDFLKFMSIALERYYDTEEVMQIAGHTIAPPPDLKNQAFFLPITTTWGWGTWKRAWKSFSWQPVGWPEKKKDAEWLKLFTINGAGDYIAMLEDRLRGDNDSWGILWWYVVSIRQGKVLYPANNLVSNFGFDGSGVHCGSADSFNSQTQNKIENNFATNELPDKILVRPLDLYLLEEKLRKKDSGIKAFVKTLGSKNNRVGYLIDVGIKVVNIGYNFRDHCKIFMSKITKVPEFLMHRRRMQLVAASCRLGEGSELGPEAVIDNNRMSPKYIDIGANSFCRGRLLLYGHGGQIKVGDYCYIGIRTEIWSMQSIQIGDRVLIAHDVNIHDGTAHSTDAIQRHEHFKHISKIGHPITWDDMPGVIAEPIIIEDDVWISFGVTILRGVRIGKGSIISAGSVVTSDVPPGMVYQNKVEPQLRPLNK